ncbi:thioesterase II family protein [Kitasatospora indigofera]|uniref:thioesterase II family protein n=1 Tax=Kitasatospora indigofera TaxID=67307 RepID=UPI0033BCF8A0
MSQLRTAPAGRRPLVEGAVTCPRPVPGASFRLFLFHHAGGSHLLYRGWETDFPADWEVMLVDAPGRAHLLGERPLDTSEELVGYLRRDLLPWLDRPYAFFGHSMGALVAYELTRRLPAGGGAPAPSWLGLSACGPAGSRDLPRDQRRHLLPDAELRDRIRLVGGTPPNLLEDDDLWRLFGPIFRSDFAVVDTWEPVPGRPPLTVPVSVFGGHQDDLVAPDRLAHWADHARYYLGLHLYRGDHFYLSGQQRSVTRQIVASIRLALRIGGAVRAAPSTAAPSTAASSTGAPSTVAPASGAPSASGVASVPGAAS